jgi:uncharacterized protein
MNPIGWAKVVDRTNDGCTIKISDLVLLLPRDEQLGPIDIGDDCLVLILQEEETNNYIVSEKIDNYIPSEIEEGEYAINQKLEGYIYRKTELGLKIYFDNKYSGIVYRNEIFRDYELGDKVEVYIKKIRDDGKVDLSFQPIGYRAAVKSSQEIVMQKLNENDGVLKLSDKSTPEEVYSVLGISKKKFKEAIGTLYKKKMILIEENQIRRFVASTQTHHRDQHRHRV